MKEKPKGGLRKGAGRKPSLDPKQPVTIFVETSKINYYGGKEGVQLFCYNALDADKEISFAPPKDVYDSPGLDNSKFKDEPVFKKKFPPSDAIIKAKGVKASSKDGVVVSDLTKPTGVLKPQEQPKTNLSVNAKPKTLDELKALCPYPEKSSERSDWIRAERPKYGV